MHKQTSSPDPQVRLSGKLGVGAIVFMVVAAAAPLTVVAGLTPVGILLGTGPGFPGMFVVVGGIFFLFAVGLCAMAARVSDSGGFFAYIASGLGFRAGVSASFLAVLMYTSSQVGVYAFLGLQISNFTGALGLPVPWWAATLVCVAIVGYMGYRHIDFSARALVVLLLGEVLVTVIISVAIVLSRGADGLTLAPITPGSVFAGNVGVGIMFAVSSFVGFESTTIYRDEARNPEKTIPRATYIAVTGVAVFYLIGTWAFVMGWGVDRVVEEAARTLAQGDMYQQTAVRYVGTWLGVVVNILLITSLFACILSFHNVTSRYLFANGQRGIFHRRLGSISPKHSSPGTASLCVTAGVAVLLLALIVAGLQPGTQLFPWFAGVGVVGVLILMIATSAAVIGYLHRNPEGVNRWRRIVAPILAIIGLVVCFVFVVTNFNILVSDIDANGNPIVGPITLTILGVIFASPILGFLWGMLLQRRNGSSALPVRGNAVPTEPTHST